MTRIRGSVKDAEVCFLSGISKGVHTSAMIARKLLNGRGKRFNNYGTTKR